MQSIMFRIMNLDGLHHLEEENELLSDPEEREARRRLIEAVMDKVTDYDVHVREYAWKQTARAIQSRGISLEQVERDAVISAWDRCFDSLVTAEQKAFARHYSDQFRWHLFSFALLPALQGEEAQMAFDTTGKDDVFLFFDCAEETFRVKNAHLLAAEDLEALREDSPLDYADMYIFDAAGKWTYVRPHEEYCGPYYFRAP